MGHGRFSSFEARKSAHLRMTRKEKSGAARRDKTLAAPCRYSEILAGKCGFAGQPERRFDGSGMSENGNAIRVLT